MAHLFKTVVDLNQKNREVIWDTLATVGDKNAHTFAIGLRSDNRSVDLANARVQLLVRRADKKDRIITGSVSDDNYAVATLDEYCYEITGRIRCTLLISVNGATLTGVRATLTVEDGLGDVVINPAGEIPNLQDLLAEIDGMRQATAAANTAAKNANDAAAMIEQIRADIESAVNEAKEAVEEAETAVSEATTAIKEAQKITTGWANAQTEAESVPSDSPAEVNMGLDDEGNRILIFKIPKGQNGLNPHIGANGHWFVGNVDTGIKAKGDTGDDGITPHIGTNGNWFVGSADTGVRAQGPQGAPGTGSGTVTGVVLNGQTYVPNNLGVIELPELGGSDVELSDSVPSALGQNASAGKGSKAAREDHVHKMPSASDIGALGQNEQAVDSAKLAGKEPSHYENKITSITANGQTVQPDANGAVNLGTIGRSNLEIDDTTPSGNKTYSSEKIEGELSSLSEQMDNNYLPKTGTAADASKLGGVAASQYAKKTDLEGIGGDADTLGGKAPGFYTPYTNLADNSDFEHWVAQAGIGGKHGEEAYGGDRWILTSGTITGEANADGDGYSNITLNGTLVQVVPSPPSVATAFVEMVSGTAEISYDASKGEIILTSAGGVIKNVLLLPEAWSTKPEYMAKGYAAELASCCLYFQHMKANGYSQISVGFWFTETSFRTNVSLKHPMRKNPSIIIDLAEFQCVKSGSIQNTPSAITSQGINGNVLSLMLTTTKVSDNAAGMLRGGNDDTHYFSLTADLPRR